MIRVAVITISDSAVAGTREDRSGPALAERVAHFGWQVAETRLVSDEVSEIAAAMAGLADAGGAEVILSTGGTGLAARDVTPEAARSVADKEAPGFGELMRAKGRASTPWPRFRAAAGTRAVRVDSNASRVAARCGRVIRSSGGADPPRGQFVTGKNGASCATRSWVRTS